MSPGFDRDSWESRWQEANDHGAGAGVVPNPHLAREISGLAPGTALDAGCGEGAEAIWLANAGWWVTAVDISSKALALASERAARESAAAGQITWVEGDLGAWEPDERFDLVTTHYAHPAMPQLAFYRRISEWVAPSGTLLIVGHLHGPQAHVRGHHGHTATPPAEASVTAVSVTGALDADRWDIVKAEEATRDLTDRTGMTVQLADVVVRARRRQ